MNDDRVMNLIIRPDGTADLDARAPDEVVLATLGKAGVFTIRLTVNGATVGKAHALAQNSGDINALARICVVELTGAHVVLLGPVVLTNLDAGTAHLLLELVRDS